MNYVNTIADKVQNNYQTMIVASSICLIGFTILKSAFQNDNQTGNTQKVQKRKVKKNKPIDIIKNSKRTFLTDQENSEIVNDVYETDIPKTQTIKKSYAKTFYTDAEGKHNFRNRQKNKMRQENDKIDALYFAVLDKIDKKQLILNKFLFLYHLTYTIFLQQQNIVFMNKDEKLIYKSKVCLRSLKNVKFQIFLINYYNQLKEQYFTIADDVIEKYNQKENYKELLSYKKFQLADYIIRTRVNPLIESLDKKDTKDTCTKIDNLSKIFKESVDKLEFIND